jgi:hypothetical protein
LLCGPICICKQTFRQPDDAVSNFIGLAHLIVWGSTYRRRRGIAQNFGTN